jgi:D-alanyl-D-alanine carboxypeptidase (penicillin-binding protein 5/6)
MIGRTTAGGLLAGDGGRLRLAVLAAAAAVLVSVAALAAAPPPSAPRLPGGAAPPRVQAWSAVVMDRDTGEIVYAKAPGRHLPTASLTKIMTALLVLERTRNLDRYVTVPGAAVGQHGAGIGLMPGDRITVRQLLLGLMVRSATDCAITLATAIAGDEPRFALLMNRRAAGLGLTDTHFVNSTGLNVPGHYSSARDLSELGRVAMRDRRFRALVRRVWARVTWPPAHQTFIVSRNHLNARYEWVDGIKTGSTHGTGSCMVASGTYGGRRLIVTMLHEPNRGQEEKDALLLFAYGAARRARGGIAAPSAAGL